MAKSPPNGGLFPPEIVSKPSSVEYGHLSSRTVAGTFQRYSRPPPGEQPLRQRPNLAPDGVYTARRVAAAPVSSYLPFPSLQNTLRSVSVALSLKSPSPDVIRRPALWCSDFPHGITPRDRIANSGTYYYIRSGRRCQPNGETFFRRNFCKTLVILCKSIYNSKRKIFFRRHKSDEKD